MLRNKARRMDMRNVRGTKKLPELETFFETMPRTSG